MLHVNTGSAVDGQRHMYARHQLVGLQRILEGAAKKTVQRKSSLASMAARDDKSSQTNQCWCRVSIGFGVTDIAAHRAEVLHVNGTHPGGGFSQRRETRADPLVRGDPALRCHRPQRHMSLLDVNFSQYCNTV